MRGPLWYVLSIFLVAIALTVAGFLSEAPARSQNYLAGRFARTAQNVWEAAELYGRALEHDPTNEILLEQAFQVETMSGDWPSHSASGAAGFVV